ncbi:A24 family peptidase [Streptomyces sp. NBC_01525]|uniref:prepilin peptidase n=1 Tax=Streptomyces sp. NBC_01525 TaxID=2903893 RepID=UPI00386CEE11
MELTLTLLGAVFGGAAGALVPRAAYRFAVDAAEPWRARCPRGHAIAGPWGGWVGFARCPSDARPEGGGACRYGPGRGVAPAVSALVCGLLAAVVGARPELAVLLVVTPFAVLLSAVDGAVHRLPDVVTLPLAAATVALLGAAALLPGHGGSWVTAVAGSLALAALYGTLFLVNPAGMGLGDVKLALSVGALLGWYGWPTLFLGTFAAFGAGALFGVALMVLRRAHRRTAMAFGPFMLAGALVGVVGAG